MKEKKKEKSAWNIKTRSLSLSLSVRARKRNVEKEEEEKSPRKAREGGNKETLFFLSTIFLIKLDQSETELRPWLHLLFKPVKIYYQTRLPTKASINPSSISFYPVDLIVSYSTRDFAQPILPPRDRPALFFRGTKERRAQVSSPLAGLVASCP